MTLLIKEASGHIWVKVLFLNDIANVQSSLAAALYSTKLLVTITPVLCILYLCTVLVRRVIFERKCKWQILAVVSGRGY